MEKNKARRGGRVKAGFTAPHPRLTDRSRKGDWGWAQSTHGMRAAAGKAPSPAGETRQLRGQPGTTFVG